MFIYFIIISITMIIYEGGDRFNPSLENYNFFGSFLSDLGRMHGFDGMETFGTAIFYGVGLISMGTGAIAFFIAHNQLIKSVNKLLRFATLTIGIASGMGYIGIALTPWDLFAELHLFCVFFGFISFIFASFLTGISIRRQPNYPNKYSTVYIVFSFVLVSYILLMIFGPQSEFPIGRIIQACGQKILVFTQMIIMTYTGIGAIKQTYK